MLQSAKHHHTVYLIDSSNGVLKNIDPQDQLSCNQHYMVITSFQFTT